MLLIFVSEKPPWELTIKFVLYCIVMNYRKSHSLDHSTQTIFTILDMIRVKASFSVNYGEGRLKFVRPVSL